MRKIRLTFFFLILFFACQTKAEVIEQVFKTLNDDYINEISFKEITLKGLTILPEIDPRFKIIETSKKLFLYKGKKMIQKFPLPLENASLEEWSKLNQNILQAAISSSEKAELIDFELEDRFARKVFENLDGYSHYFGKFSDEKEEPLKIRRSFASRIVGDNILLIRILNFQKDVSQKVLTAIEECSKCQGLILDLRSNHGGLLNEAISIADMFLDEGIIAYTQDDQDTHYYTAKEGDIFKGKPIVVLSDGFTASAAEVLAAALTEQDRAVLIGTKTYGKGTVQNVMKMKDNRAISLTTSFFYTPAGSQIDKTGLTPFICTGTNGSCDKEDRFHKEEDIETAIKYLKNLF